MTYPCIEKTIEIVDPTYTVRLWIDHTDGQMVDSEYAVSQVKGILSKTSVIREIEDYLALNIEHVNAVQVIDTYPMDGIREGEVIYTVDFENHG